MATSPAKKAIDANRGKVAPFVTNQVSLHDHQPQKIDGKVYNLSSSQIPNLDQHVATMTIPLQVSVPASFFSSSSNYYSFKMQAGCYSCKNLTLEMDLTNTLLGFRCSVSSSTTTGRLCKNYNQLWFHTSDSVWRRIVGLSCNEQ